MTLVQGDLWQELGVADYLLVTTNATIKRDGTLVMGRGAAEQARDRFAGLDAQLGREIAAQSGGRRPFIYGIVVANAYHGRTQLGAFQVKHHFKEPARLELIGYACGLLHGFILREQAAGKQPRVALNFPGIGYGGLPRDAVLPLLENLPDGVVIYEYPA